MKIERHTTRLGMVMVAVASLLVACAVEGDEAVIEEPPVVAKASTVTGDELSSIFVTPMHGDEVNAAAAPCRRVTAASIPVYSTATSSTVNCRFLRGDTVSYIAVSNGRFLSWCPRRTPPSQGVFSWGTLAGTVEVTCPW